MTEPDNTQSDDSAKPVAPKLPGSLEPPAENDALGEPAAAAGAIPAARDPDETVGTGSAIAIGCIAATLLLIVIGLVFLGIIALLN